MKKKFKLLLIIITLCVPSYLFGQNLNPTLYLESIQTSSLNENNAKKIYFIVTSFSNQDKNEFYTVPGFLPYKTHHSRGYIPVGTAPFPIYYWSTKAFSQLSHVEIWHGTLKDNEAVELNISIMERNAPPWNLDDELGTIKGMLRNQKGHLKVSWQAFNNASLEGALLKQNDMIYAFKVKQDKVSYQLNFYLVK